MLQCVAACVVMCCSGITPTLTVSLLQSENRFSEQYVSHCSDSQSSVCVAVCIIVRCSVLQYLFSVCWKCVVYSMFLITGFECCSTLQCVLQCVVVFVEVRCSACCSVHYYCMVLQGAFRE